VVDVCIYETTPGKFPFTLFLDSIRSLKDRARILTRLDRVESGNFGDYKSLGDGLFELRFFFGSGYRVYFGMNGNQCVILLCGGDKSSQEKDILMARRYWKSFLEDNQ